ncbi:unnamed protein product [Somion occarium]|uniref:C2H2-type domain-containing protein n=1 Tax=Somion occarium TaxID=3059160 RepID=A0ABP1DUT9_9APHY
MADSRTRASLRSRNRTASRSISPSSSNRGPKRKTRDFDGDSIDIVVKKKQKRTATKKQKPKKYYCSRDHTPKCFPRKAEFDRHMTDSHDPNAKRACVVNPECKTRWTERQWHNHKQHLINVHKEDVVAFCKKCGAFAGKDQAATFDKDHRCPPRPPPPPPPADEDEDDGQNLTQGVPVVSQRMRTHTAIHRGSSRVASNARGSSSKISTSTRNYKSVSSFSSTGYNSPSGSGLPSGSAPWKNIQRIPSPGYTFPGYVSRSPSAPADYTLRPAGWDRTQPTEPTDDEGEDYSPPIVKQYSPATAPYISLDARLPVSYERRYPHEPVESRYHVKPGYPVEPVERSYLPQREYPVQHGYSSDRDRPFRGDYPARHDYRLQHGYPPQRDYDYGTQRDSPRQHGYPTQHGYPAQHRHAVERAPSPVYDSAHSGYPRYSSPYASPSRRDYRPIAAPFEVPRFQHSDRH